VEPLEQVAARTASSLVITIGSAEPLTLIKDSLASNPSGSCRIKLVCWIENVQEVELDIPGGYAVGPDVLARLRQVPGVYDVQQL
jgi:hypothetical protein